MEALAAALAAEDGHELARAARNRLRQRSVALTFGEVDLDSFAAVLAAADPQPGDSFVDLGSGLGRAVLAARALFPLGRVRGVELLEELHEGAQRVAAAAGLADAVELECGNMLAPECDWSDADVVYCANCLFPDALVARIAERALLLKPGARVVSLKRLPALEGLEERSTSSATMSWGEADVWVYIRVGVWGGVEGGGGGAGDG